MKRLIVALASTVALVMGGSAAASLVPIPEVGVVSSVTGSALPDPGSQADSADAPTLPGRVSSLVQSVLASLGLGSEPEPEPAPGSPVAGDDGVVPDQTGKAPAGPFSGLPAGGFAAYGTGTVHSNQPIGIEIGFSGATWASGAVAARTDELGRSVAPALASGHGFGRGSAVEIDAPGLSDLDDNADAKAPPNRDVVTKQVTDVDLSPVLHADILNSKAYARAATSGCVVGPDLAFGFGSATGSNLFENGEAESVVTSRARRPPREVAQSVSRTRLVAPAGPASGFGLLAETRQTIAPFTLFEGEDDEFTIELLGEWVLRAQADGTTGSIAYGPEEATPDTPVLRLTGPDGDEQSVITFQQFTSQQGNVRRIAGAEIAIGEDPRAIGGEATSAPTETGTLASGAVDVVRVRILDGPEQMDLRLGHMEVAVAVPERGISCPGIGMAKQSDPPTVTPGQRFTWTITASNLNDCRLEKLKVVDTITTTPGLRYRIVSTSPAATVSGSTLTFDRFGPLDLGQSAVVRIEVEVDEQSAPGRFTDEAASTGICGPAPVKGDAEATTGVGAAAPQSVPREGKVSLQAPEVRPAALVSAGPVAPAVPRPAPTPAPDPVASGRAAAEVLPRTDVAAGAGQLPRTGGVVGLVVGLVMLGSAQVVRRLKRRIP